MTATIQTHYATLGLAPEADLPVIRAAYKALVLIHHPDKTLHLTPEERASHAAIFRDIQEAYDVLGSPSFKAAYDAELERHGNRVDAKRSTFHRSAYTRKPSSPTPKRSHSIHLTTPDEKRAMKAKVEQDLAYLQEQRAKRDANDAKLDDAGLKFMLQTWVDLAEEHQDDAYLRAHCAIQMQVYQAKVARREKEHEEWLASMSKPKGYPQTPPTPAPKKAAASARRTTPVSSFQPGKRAEDRKRAEAQRAEEEALRMQARQEEKSRKEAAKQAHLDAKAAAVRAEREKQKQKLEALAKEDAERVAKARAKAGAPPKGTVGANAPLCDEEAYSGRLFHNATDKLDDVKPGPKKVCAKCELEHGSFAEWRKCNMQNSKQKDGDEEEVYLLFEI
ncbi:DnaJ-domain-containing protein [Trematosphaeria pertusa]|uniref:DnaJ-domain-containing protein n=1 Tax=Trematosphaeria pertusa TaxID=390896 RepID=A0A6A6IU58_9PLEO|nr:DnaJ-domain-containing protein [Trematosphaeria pertusa]KAF2253728.1 DnaJ-domain-containing protein [Trematosphaeria pertusa]